MGFEPKRPDFWGLITLAAWISEDGNTLSVRGSQQGSAPLFTFRLAKQASQGKPVVTKDKSNKGSEWVVK